MTSVYLFADRTSAAATRRRWQALGNRGGSRGPRCRRAVEDALQGDGHPPGAWPGAGSAAPPPLGRPGGGDPRTWSQVELAGWFQIRGLPEEICQKFKENLVNGELGALLDDGDLSAMGIEQPLRRRRVLLELDQLFRGASDAPLRSPAPDRPAVPVARPTSPRRRPSRPASAQPRPSRPTSARAPTSCGRSRACTPRAERPLRSRPQSHGRFEVDTRLSRRLLHAEALSVAVAVLQGYVDGEEGLDPDFPSR